MINDIFIDMSISFLLHATRILHVGDYDNNSIKIIFDHIQSIDNEVIFTYNESGTILGYENDLELLIEIIERMISILEKTEEYEKCLILKNKKEECLLIKNTKTT
jgi:hypothetical protein